jgi:hypothetical protein
LTGQTHEILYPDIDDTNNTDLRGFFQHIGGFQNLRCVYAVKTGTSKICANTCFPCHPCSGYIFHAFAVKL